MAVYGVALGAGRRHHATCRRSRSSTSTAGRSCRRSTAPGRSAASSAPPSRWPPADLPSSAVAAVVAVLPLVVAFAPFLPRAEQSVAAAADGRRRAVAADRAGRAGDGALLHGRHRRVHLGTAVPRQGLPDARPAWSRSPSLPYLLASGVVRLAGDRLVAPVRRGARAARRRRRRARRRWPSSSSPRSWPVAVLGFTLLGGGVAVVAPLSFSAAARIAGAGRADPALRQARVDAVIGALQPVQLRRRAARRGA